ncbi:hypothetical protein [Nonomuraea jabiensis]|uniref:Uncharacterized protein n=1 Tax=Nonomuraea jabiensis TaxID=882448 RepID=A0A7W9GEH7_9ACTN|nr:hypothetical protein [Nonomuraea jabiensis]MBB5782242.1 hypothetical protein [Nonomuraea jabiensis]
MMGYMELDRHIAELLFDETGTEFYRLAQTRAQANAATVAGKARARRGLTLFLARPRQRPAPPLGGAGQDAAPAGEAEDERS